MSNNNQPPNKTGSLQGTFKRRNSEKIDQLIETRRLSGTVQAPPTNDTQPASQPIKTAPRASTSNFVFPSRAERKQAVQPESTASTPVIASAPSSSSRPNLSDLLTPARMKLLTIVMIVLLVIVLAVGIVLIISNPGSNGATADLPVVSAGDVIAQLKKVGVPVTNVRELASDDFWKPKQEIEFEFQRPGDKGSIDKGTFTVLSFDSDRQAGDNMLRAFGDDTYKNWQLIHTANVIVATSPETSANLVTELHSHLNQYLLAPYLPFLPTSTASTAIATVMLKASPKTP